MIVDIFFRELICDRITPESGIGSMRDEVYIEVYGSTPSGNISARLPRSRYREDYYTFYNNQVSKSSNQKSWVNQDGALMGEPWIWSGNLNNHQKADLFVVIGEQDNKELASATNALKAAIEQANRDVGNNPLAEAAVAGAQQFVGRLDADPRDDIIGAFHIHLKNENGKIRVVWLPLKKLDFRNVQGQTTLRNTNDHYATALAQSGNIVQSFTFNGAPGGRYRGIVQVKIRNQGQPRKAHKYLITEFDACSPRNQLSIYNLDFRTIRLKLVGRVGRGGVKAFDVSHSNWYWKCGNSGLEITRGANSAIRHVRVHRHNSTGQIRWYCFNDENW